MRVGVPRDYFFDAPELDEEVRAAVLGAIEAMGRAGARIVEVAIPRATAGQAACTVTIRSESYGYHERDLRDRPELYGRHTRRALTIGALFTAADFVQAQRVRSIVKAETAAALAGADVLVVPTMLSPAAEFEGYDPDGRLANPSYTGIWNMTGSPALSVPCGFSRAGLPIGMQIVGRPFDEATVLRVGDAYQRLTDWHTRAPRPGAGDRVSGVGDVERFASSATPPEPAAAAAVEAILERSRLRPDDEERARLARVYPTLRAQADALRLVDLGPREPALIFPAR